MRSITRQIYEAALGACARLSIHDDDIAAVKDVAWEAGARAALSHERDVDEDDPGVAATVHELRRLDAEISELERAMGR